MTLVASSRAAQPHFQQQIVRRGPAEGEEGCSGGDLEEGDGLAAIGRFAFFQKGCEIGLGNQRARHPDALMEPHQMRRGVGMNRQACRFHHVAEIGNRRTLAIGAGHMDDRRQLALGMAKDRQKPLHAPQAEVDDLGMQREQPRQDGIAERHGDGVSPRGERGPSPAGCGLAPSSGCGRCARACRASRDGARPCPPCRVPADIRRAGSPRAASRGWSVR